MSPLRPTQGPIVSSLPGSLSYRCLSTGPLIPSVLEPESVLAPPGEAGAEAAALTASATDDALTPLSTFMDPLIDPLSSFLLGIPHPLGYGATIILLTLLVRTVFTLPVSLWQRKRAVKAKRLVEPEMRAINQTLAVQLAADCRRKGIGYKEYLLRLRKELAKAQSALHKKHGTHPFITTWSPLLVHIPIFVTLSLTIRRTLELPSSSVFNESFLWLDKLGEVDPYGILPLVGMGVAFGNAEIVGRKNNAKQTSPAATEGEKGSDKMADKSTASQAEPDIVQPEKTTRVSSSAKPPTTTGLFRPSSSPSSSTSTSSTARTSAPRSRSLSTSLPTPPSSGAITRKPIPASSNRPPKPSSTTPTPAPKRASPTQQKRSPASKESQGPKDVLVSVSASGDKVDPNNPPFSPARQAEIRRGFMSGVLRFSALGFGMIASQMPAGVTLYWVTSMTFSLVQNVVLSLLPRRRQEMREVKQAEGTTGP